MANYPSQLKKRDELNLRLGIKSSLSQLRSVIASLYVIYVANNKHAQVTYSQEFVNSGLTSIKLDDALAQLIDKTFPAIDKPMSSLVSGSSLFSAQLEALQVGIELFFHLAKINFVATGLSERTGSSRFQKKLFFATNMVLLDLYLSSHTNDEVNKLLVAWLEDKPYISKLEDGLKILLNTFTEETQYKIRDNNLDEIIFNQEGVYGTILNDGEVISKDANEPVGPFRIYKAYIASGMHPYLVEKKQEFKLNESVSVADLENYAQLVSTALDITPRKTFIESEISSSSEEESVSKKQLETTLYTFDDPTKLVWESIKLFNKEGIVKELLKSKYRTAGGSLGNYIRINDCYVAMQGEIEGFDTIFTDCDGVINNNFHARDIDKFAKAVNDIFCNRYKVIIDGEQYKLIKLQQQFDVNKEYASYLTALRTKPFMLLAGISGTGKSRIARQIAKACWTADSEERTKQVPSNFCMIQVKPNWHDSTELLGYVSRIEGEKYVSGKFLPFVAKAWENLDVPHILCLDEMNLAPVEQYFAEYLSVIESRKLNEDGTITTDPIITAVAEQWFWDLVQTLTSDGALQEQFKKKGITLPPNLFVIGTVNMDETTFSFSRKVLDRAMTIEMNEVDLEGGLTKEEQNELGEIGNSIIGLAAEGKDVYEDHKDYCDQVIEYLKLVNEELENTPFKIAYRTRNEFLLYAVNRKAFDKESELSTALDEMTSMKILPRIEGDSERVKTPLEALRNLMIELGWNEENSTSLKKIKEMLTKLQQSGYTSYWT